MDTGVLAKIANGGEANSLNALYERKIPGEYYFRTLKLHSGCSLRIRSG